MIPVPDNVLTNLANAFSFDLKVMKKIGGGREDSDDELYLIDFDVSNYHFFASDIAIAIQSVLFTHAGGMERPVENKESLQRFLLTCYAGIEMNAKFLMTL